MVRVECYIPNETYGDVSNGYRWRRAFGQGEQT